MSETEFRIGKVEEIPLLEPSTFAEKMEELKKVVGRDFDYYEEDKHIEDDKLFFIDNRVFEIIEDKDIILDDIAEANQNPDGTISYTLKYYNGGVGFRAMLERAIKKMETV